MKPNDLKTQISESLANLKNTQPVGAHGVRSAGTEIVGATGQSPLRETATALLNTLGYDSEKTLATEDNTPGTFLATFDPDNRLDHDRALLDKWQTANLLFQLTDEELNLAKVPNLRKVYDPRIYQSYLFIAIELTDEAYSRTKLVGITREVNKLFAMPAMLLFKAGDRLTLAIINRRPDKRDASKDVLEKVTLIKDINLVNPHRAHIDILFDLALPNLAKHKISNFLDLHNAWQKTLDTSELNKKFFREVADWYFWAMQKVAFPDDAEKDADLRNATSLIRLITRLIFVWFLKEKGLVPARLFDETKIDQLLNKTDRTNSTYYKAILQNLFFATLNTEMNRDAPKGKSRQFVKDQYMVHTFYRYRRYFKDPDAALKLFEDIPFLNGGLFECLDRKDGAGNEIRIDCFSENAKHETRLQVPDELFFCDEQTVDLNDVFGDKRHSKEKVRGIIRILDSYKFTVAENTPLEEEVALDPELLGKVFENLLASYNPETKTTARKQTGSFYTPREIVNYMVDESLIAYLETKLVEYHESQTTFGAVTPPSQKEIFGKGKPQQTKLVTKKIKLTDKQKKELNDRLRQLFAYTEEGNPFSEAETDALIRAIDACKILDPACGSGAFPMGILHRMVYLLGKLDPHNRKWKQRQIDKVQEIPDAEVREQLLNDIEQNFEENDLDYGRKLYLIENCIYGVDIQPIACQIAKLRFFISLVVNQRVDRSQKNFGIRPLPNLETHFVAANTLIGIEKGQMGISEQLIEGLKGELKKVRQKYFTALTYKTKEKCRKDDADLRQKMATELKSVNVPGETCDKLARWNPYDQNASADFFDMEWMFGIRDGFDVVIGNPPYGVQFTKEEKQLYNRLFKFQNYQLDSYLLFIEKAFGLVSTSALIAYIIPNPWRTNLRLKNIRRLILTESRIISIVNYKAKVFDATVDTEVIILKKVRPTNNVVRIKIVAESDQIIENKVQQKKWKLLAGEPINIFITEKENRILDKIRSHSVELRQVCKVISGLVPYEKGRGNPPQTRQMVQNRVYDSHEKLDESYRHVLRGKDIEKYLIKWKGDRWIKYGDNLAAPRYSADFDATEKIVMRQTGDSLVATIDTKQFVCLKNMHVVHSRDVKIELRYILGLLNSKLMNFYYQSLNPEIGEALAEVKKENVEKLQIKSCDLEEQQKIIKVVNRIISIKSSNLAADTSALENQIDLLVYKLHGLTHAEVKIVDPEFAMSEAEYEAVQA